ncbi:MAG: hypothetical protein R2875_09160 [Desulfobacterales bacterium]
MSFKTVKTAFGERTARKIIATLQGKMGKICPDRDAETDAPVPTQDFVDQVIGVLVEQLGHRLPGKTDGPCRHETQTTDFKSRSF